MACKLLLTGARLPFLWNVSTKVGDTHSCPNSRTDVELVNSFLYHLVGGNHSANSKVQRNTITVNGDFDIATGYWIYCLQMMRNESGVKGGTVDGKIGSAKHFDLAKWTIVYLNQVLFNINPQVFNAFDKLPMHSAALKAELVQVKR